MRTLVYVANRLPWPLDDGWKRRTFAVLEGLSRIADVHFVVPAASTPALQAEFVVAAGLHNRLVVVPNSEPASGWRTASRSLLSSESPLSLRHYTRALEQAVIETVEACSPAAVVYAGAFLAERHAGSAIARVPFVVDTHNIDSHALARRAASQPPIRAAATRFVSRRLRNAEINVFSNARAVLVCSDDEVSLVHERARTAHAYVVPNGVDTELFRVGPAKSLGPMTQLLFFGNLDYPPNIDAMQYFAREIYPELQSQGVRYCLQVVGAGHGTRVRELTSRLPEVSVTGLSEDLVRTLHESDAVLVPLRAGGGTRLKVLEALSSGRPVISTRLGAEGIAVEDSVQVMFAETPAEFARAIISLRTDPERAARIANAGADLVRAGYSWAAIQARLGDIIRTRVGAGGLDSPPGGA